MRFLRGFVLSFVNLACLRTGLSYYFHDFSFPIKFNSNFVSGFDSDRNFKSEPLRVFVSILLSFTFVFLLIPSDVSFGQIYSVQNYSTERGIASRSVYDAAQDKNGIMWFATAAGVSRYDGFKFVNYEFKRDIHKVAFRKILRDEKGFMWFIPLSTSDSIRVVRDGVWDCVAPPDNKFVYGQNNSFAVMYYNNEPLLFLGTMNGIYVYRDKVWKNYSVDAGLISAEVMSVIEFEKKIYIGTWKGLSVFDGEKFDNSINTGAPELRDGVLKTVFRRGGMDGSAMRMWVLQKKRVGYVENGVFTAVTSDFELPFYDVKECYSLTFDRKDNVYFGCLLAKFYLNSTTGKVEKLFKENGFAADGCTSIFIDREENVWVADWKGLGKINSFAFRNHSTANGMEEDEVTAINEIAPKVYVFGHSQGYTIMKNREMKYFPFDTKEKLVRSNFRVLDMHKDTKGSVWMAVYNKGIARFDGTDVPVWLKTPDSVSFSSVVTDDFGRVFAGSYKGIYVLKNGAFEEMNIDSMSYLMVRKIFNVHDGKLWAATPMGIYVIDGENARNISVKNNVRASNTFSVYKDRRQRILAGTDAGLFICTGDSLMKFSENGFAIDDAVYAITQDRMNNYWIATSKNLIYWDGGNTKKVYNSRNGLIQGEINRSSLFFDSSERLWIGTEFGVSRYVPELDNNMNLVPKAEILGVQENGNEILKLDKDVSFGAGNNNLKFVFRAVSFVDENSIEYAVKLDGYDKDWVYMGQHELDEVVYKNLPAGNYVLRVKARNLSGDWGYEAASNRITIEKVFYLKWWFILIAVLFAGTGLTGYHLYKSKNMYMSKLEVEVKKRTEELMKAKDELTLANANLEIRVESRTKELAESESKFRSVVEQASEGIVIYDMESRRLLLTNKTYEMMLDYGKDEMYGLTLYDIVSDNRESVDNNIEKIDKEELVLIGERMHRKKSGGMLEVEVSVSKILYGGKPAMCVVARDITERKKVENALIKLSEDQKELIAEKDKFFSIIAHDLRSPFSGLLGFTELLKSNIDSLSEDELKEYAAHIHNSGKNVFDLLDNLLKWGKLQTGKTEVTMKRVDLTDSVKRAITLLKDNSEKKEIEVINEVYGLYDVCADSYMVDSILQNVLTNAIKFTPRKGKVRFSAERVEDMVEISVSDTGVGISKNKIENIFRLDMRVTSEGTENEPGTGLGIVLCRDMVERMGGSFEIESEEGKGTIVRARFRKDHSESMNVSE